MPLTALFKRWGYETIALGNVNDSMEKIKKSISFLNIITSPDIYLPILMFGGLMIFSLIY